MGAQQSAAAVVPVGDETTNEPRISARERRRSSVNKAVKLARVTNAIRISSDMERDAEAWLQSLGPLGGALSSRLMSSPRFKEWFGQQQEDGAEATTVEHLKEILSEVDVVAAVAECLATTSMDTAELNAAKKKRKASAEIVRQTKLAQSGRARTGLADEDGGSSSSLSGALSTHNKFAESTFELAFSDLSDFFGGLENLVGSPNPEIETGLKDEHLMKADSIRHFSTSNYNMTTSSLVEWWFVADPTSLEMGTGRTDASKFKCSQMEVESIKKLRMSEDERSTLREKLDEFGHGANHVPSGNTKATWPREDAKTLKQAEKSGARARAPRSPYSFVDRTKGGEIFRKNEQLAEISAAELLVVELVAARLYSGPMFVKYNAVLRGLRLEFARYGFLELCAGDDTALRFTKGELNFEEAVASKANLYPTTLLAINSSILKLSKLTVACQVFRGVGDGRLPPSFIEKNKFLVRGGVECAFMSTTPNPSVAQEYAIGRKSNTGIVFEMQ